MTGRVLSRIRAAIRDARYDMTVHALSEMAEEGLDLSDVEAAVLNGSVARVQRDDLRGNRYTIQGVGANGQVPVGVIGRFTGTGRFLIITVYKVTDI